MRMRWMRLTVALILSAMLVARTSAADAPPANGATSMLAAAIELYGSLTDAQRTRAVLPFNSPERFAEVFTPGPRPGIPLRELNDHQRSLAESLLRQFTSEYGAKKCEAIAAQDHTGLERLYLVFFGEPGEGKTYAWRVAEHHLTLVHVDVERGQVASVGPVLLGADPPTLWDTEEDQLIGLY